MSVLAAVLLAAASAPIVEGRVGEPAGVGAAWAQVTLLQGERTQVMRTGADGRFRFRAFEGEAMVTVRLPQGWIASGPLSRAVGPAFRGDVLRAEFAAKPRRVMHGRLLVNGAPLAGAQLTAAGASASTDERGQFLLEGLPAGLVDVKVVAPPLSGRVELPVGPGEVSRDVSIAVPELVSLHLDRVPQGGVARSATDWLTSKPLTNSEIAGLERLSALVALDPAFRLVMVASRPDAARGAQAASMLQRYLTGPALVPRDRLLFAVADFVTPGRLQLILTRQQEPR